MRLRGFVKRAMRNDARAPIAVVTAIREEFRAVLRAARDVRFEGPARARARIGSAEVVIASTGDGPQNAERAATALCETVRPKALIGAGVAGGLTEGLSVLDVVASARVRQETEEAPGPDPALLERASRAGARGGSLITVAAPAVSLATRRRLASWLAAGESGAVDMESAAWARAAAGRGTPYIVLRAISDTMDEELPAFLPDCVGEDGGISRRAVAVRALLRPASWAALARMRRRVEDCGPALARVLDRFLAELL